MGEWREISVRRGASGAQTVEAEVNGLFGLHPAVEREGRWALTHLATGYRFPLFHSRGEAVEVHRAVEHLEWDFDDPDAIPETTRRECGRIVRDITGRGLTDPPIITIKGEA